MSDRNIFFKLGLSFKGKSSGLKKVLQAKKKTMTTVKTTTLISWKCLNKQPAPCLQTPLFLFPLLGENAYQSHLRASPRGRSPEKRCWSRGRGPDSRVTRTTDRGCPLDERVGGEAIRGGGDSEGTRMTKRGAAEDGAAWRGSLQGFEPASRASTRESRNEERSEGGIGGGGVGCAKAIAVAAAETAADARGGRHGRVVWGSPPPAHREHLGSSSRLAGVPFLPGEQERSPP